MSNLYIIRIFPNTQTPQQADIGMNNIAAMEHYQSAQNAKRYLKWDKLAAQARIDGKSIALLRSTMSGSVVQAYYINAPV